MSMKVHVFMAVALLALVAGAHAARGNDDDVHVDMDWDDFEWDELTSCVWKPAKFETFEYGSFGWSNNTVESCPGCGRINSILGGKPGVVTDRELTKKFAELPEHNMLRVRASYYFIDDWAHEVGFLKVDDRLEWTASTGGLEWRGLNMCGGAGTDYVGQIIDVTMRHTDGCATLTFGSTLHHDANAAYGIGHVQLFTCSAKENHHKCNGDCPAK